MSGLRLLNVTRNIRMFRCNIFPYHPLTSRTIRPRTTSTILVNYQIFNLPIDKYPLRNRLIQGTTTLQTRVPRILSLMNFLTINLGNIMVMSGVFPTRFIRTLTIQTLKCPTFRHTLCMKLNGNAIALSNKNTSLRHLNIMRHNLSNRYRFPEITLYTNAHDPTITLISRRVTSELQYRDINLNKATRHRSTAKM